MIQRAIAALPDPARFFAELAKEPPRPRAAFALLTASQAASSLAGGVALFYGHSPQLAQLRALLPAGEVSPVLLFGLLVLLAPLGALIAWPFVWMPIRLGAGRVPRLWEVAAWSQLPALLLAPFQLTVMLALEPGHPLGSLIAAVGLGASTLFVYTGVRELSRGRAGLAAAFHVLFWAMVSFAAPLLQGGAPTGGTIL